MRNGMPKMRPMCHEFPNMSPHSLVQQ